MVLRFISLFFVQSGTDMTGGSYVPSVPLNQSGQDNRRPRDQPERSRVSFGPAPTNQTPRHKNQSDLVTVAAIPLVNENDQKEAQKQKSSSYQEELNRQVGVTIRNFAKNAKRPKI